MVAGSSPRTKGQKTEDILVSVVCVTLSQSRSDADQEGNTTANAWFSPILFISRSDLFDLKIRNQV